MVSWWWDVLSGATGTVFWVSHIQLFVDYTSATGETGPMKLLSWQNGSDLPLQGLRSYPFKRRVQWFAKVLKEILRHWKLPVVYKYCRPESEMLAMFCGSMAIPWPKGRLVLIDKWLRTFLIRPLEGKPRHWMDYRLLRGTCCFLRCFLRHVAEAPESGLLS
jgi:hypothetical protein